MKASTDTKEEVRIVGLESFRLAGRVALVTGGIEVSGW